jgi:Phage minor structural protein GP20
MSERLKQKIGEELYNKLIETGLKANEIDLLDGWIPKSRLNEEISKRKTLEEKIVTYESKGVEIDKLLKDNEELKNQYSTLNEKYKSDLEMKDTEIVNISKRTKIEKALFESGAMHADLLMSKINLDDLKIDGENIIGLTDKIAGLKTNYKELFKETTTNSNTEAKPSENKQQDIKDVDWGDALSKF